MSNGTQAAGELMTTDRAPVVFVNESPELSPLTMFDATVSKQRLMGCKRNLRQTLVAHMLLRNWKTPFDSKRVSRRAPKTP
jgi:hypothetical protein